MRLEGVRTGLAQDRTVFIEYGDDPAEVRNLTSAPATVYATLVAPGRRSDRCSRMEDDPPPCA